ncbi:MAG: DUF86 domain-containing protein [Deltaproteobacteria bacterium]|nr:DUF86 domain-containing protein [Deltaproteobacteria bacterium]
MTDLRLVRRKIAELEGCVKSLDEMSAYSLGELEKDVQKAWAAERGLQLAIQMVIDIGMHILSAEGQGDIEDYAGAIQRLGELGVIPKKFAAKIKGMAGFRNVLVHEYADVDLKRVHGALRRELDDFRRFARYVTKYTAGRT